MKRNITILISVLVMMLMPFFSSPLSREAMFVLGVFLGTLILWLNISIDWPSILCLMMLGFVPSIGINNVLKSSFGNNTIMFLMMTFILTYALSKTSYIKRVALFFIDGKLAKKSPWFFVSLFFLSIIVIGCFISPTVLFIVYLPILETILTLLQVEKGEKLGGMLMMGLVFCSAISSGMTPIAHVFPLISMGLIEKTLKISVSYATYMGFAIPVGILVFLLMLLMFRYIYRPDIEKLQNVNVDFLRKEVSQSSTQEKIVLLIFVGVIVLWVLPGFIKPFVGGGILSLITRLDKMTTAFPPMLGVSLLFIIQIDNKPLLEFKEAMSKGVLWSAIIMCSATLALGSALTSKDIGITTYVTTTLIPIFKGISPLLLILIFVAWSAIQTNLSSNMVTATLVTGIVLTVFGNNDLGINVVALCLLVGMMSSYAFATPPAMPSVAVAISSGYTKTKEIMYYGFLLMFIAIIISVSVGYYLANLLV